MSYAGAVGRNVVIQFGGKVAGTVLGLITTAILQRYLLPVGYGSYTSAMAYLGFFSVIADLGLYLILIRDLNKPGADPSKITGNLLALRWLSAAIILSIGLVIVWFIPYSPMERIAVAIGTLSYVAVAATQLLVGVFQSRLAMLRVSLAELGGRVVLLVTTIWAISAHASLSFIMVAVVSGSLVNFFMVWIAARRHVSLRLRFDWPYWKSTLRDTVPIAISIVLNLIYFRADTIILRLLKTEYDVGLYGAAYKILEILNTFPIMFVGLVLPALGNAFAANDTERFARIFQRSFDLLLMAAIPILIGGWILAEPALRAISGGAFSPAAPALRLLLVAVSALFLGSLSGHVVTIINRQRQMVWSYLSVAAIGLVAYFTLIPRFSLIGAATGTIITETATMIVGYIFILRVLHIRLSFRLFPKLALAAAVIWMVATALRQTNFWLAAPLTAAAYLAVIIATKALPWSTWKELVSGRSDSVSSLPAE